MTLFSENKKSTLLWLVFYLSLQFAIFIFYGGWLIKFFWGEHNLTDGQSIFFISTDISIIFAGLCSILALKIKNLQPVSKTLLLFNAIIYTIVLIYYSVKPLSNITELFIHLVASLMVIIPVLSYEILIFNMGKSNNYADK